MSFARSLLFRLALTYAGLFLTSVLLLLALFYWVTIRIPTQDAKQTIQIEAQELLATYEETGLDTLVAGLQARAREPALPQRYHALIDPQGETVTANLPSWPERTTDRWFHIEADTYRDGDEQDHEALVLDSALPDGTRLLLGRDVEDIDDIEEALWEAGIWGLPSLALLVIVGGLAMSRAVTRRLDAMDAAARRIMNGSLGNRIPRAHTGDDLDRLAGTLNEMLARIEKSMLAVRRVSDSVAHELRTPLARMRARLAQATTASSATSPDMLRTLTEEVELMTRMFDAVLRIARIESGGHFVRRVPVDLARMFSDVAEYYEPALEEASLAISVEVEPLLTVTGDKDLIFQALANLLDNAVKFTPAGGRIALLGKHEGDDIVLTLSDTGPGIPAQIRELVTERFYRGTNDPRADGVGLGLALVEAVADLHDSRLQFSDGAPGLAVRWIFPAQSR